MDVLNNWFANCFCIGVFLFMGMPLMATTWQPRGLQLAIQLSNNYPAVPEVHRESLVFEVSIFLFIVEPKKNNCTMLLSCWQLGQILWKRDLVRFHSNRMSLFHSILRLGGKLSLRTYDEGAFAINCDSCADNPCLKWLVVLWHEYIFLVCSWKVWIFISGASIAWIHTWILEIFQYMC